MPKWIRQSLTGGITGLAVSLILYYGSGIVSGIAGGISFIFFVTLNFPAIALAYTVHAGLVSIGLAQPPPGHAYGDNLTAALIATFIFLQWALLGFIVSKIRSRKTKTTEIPTPK